MPDPLLYLMAMLAAAVSSAALFMAMLAVRQSASAARMNVAHVSAIGFGLAVGYYVLSLNLAWPPANGLDRFLTIIIPAALGIELLAGFQSLPARVAWLLRLSLAVATPRILLHGSVYLSGNEWTPFQASIFIALCGGSLAALWGLLFRLSARSAGASIPLALCLSIQCAGLTVMMAGYIKGGAASFPLVAALLATWGAAMLINRRTAAPIDFGAPLQVGIGLVGLFGLLLIGRFFGQLSTGHALTILLAPQLCWVTETELLRNRKPWIVGSIRLVLVAIPLAIVFGLAKHKFDREMGPLLVTNSVRAVQFLR